MTSFYINQKEEVYLTHLRKKIDPSFQHDSELKLAGWVASEHCNFFSSSPPVRKKAVLLKTLPYMLEEQLIDTVENYHFTLIIGQRSDPVYSCVTTHEKMQHWQEMLSAAGIHPLALYPDIYALPDISNVVSAYIGKDRCLARTDHYDGFCGRGSMFFQLLRRIIKEQDKELEIITDGRISIPREFNNKVVEKTTGWLAYLGKANFPGNMVNMLHGNYAAEKENAHNSLLKTLGWAALFLCTIFVAQQSVSLTVIQKEISKQRERNALLYEQMFQQPLTKEADLRNSALTIMSALVQRSVGEQDAAWELAVSLSDMLNQCSLCLVRKFRVEERRAEIAILARTKEPFSRDLIKENGWRLRSWKTKEQDVPAGAQPVFETEFMMITR